MYVTHRPQGSKKPSCYQQLLSQLALIFALNENIVKRNEYNAEEIQRKEYPTLKGITCLDHAGTTVPPR